MSNLGALLGYGSTTPESFGEGIEETGAARGDGGSMMGDLILNGMPKSNALHDAGTAGVWTGRETLHTGSRGEAVARVQTGLIKLGLLRPPADGAFGHGTAGAVAAFQKRHGLTPSGVVDSGTLRKLDEALVAKGDAAPPVDPGTIPDPLSYASGGRAPGALAPSGGRPVSHPAGSGTSADKAANAAADVFFMTTLAWCPPLMVAALKTNPDRAGP